MALIHRVRGGLFDTHLKATYWIWPFVGLIAWRLGYSTTASVAWAVGYLIWILPGWMSVITRAMGISVPDDQIMGMGWDVKIVDILSFGNPVFGCYVRAALYLIPLAVALVLLGVSPVGLLFVVGFFYPAYKMSFAERPTDPSSIAEWIVGGSFGLSMVIGRL